MHSKLVNLSVDKSISCSVFKITESINQERNFPHLADFGHTLIIRLRDKHYESHAQTKNYIQYIQYSLHKITPTLNYYMMILKYHVLS